MKEQTEQITKVAAQLVNLLEGVGVSMTDLETREKLIEQGEQSLGQRQRAVADQVAANNKEREELARSKAYLQQENVRVSKAQVQLDYDKGELKDLEKQEKILQTRQDELVKHELALSEKIKSLESLVAKEKELEEREAMVAKEIAVDRERKRVLDLRVERIKQRELQLHLDSELAEV